MIETLFLQYGVLGAWTVSLLYERQTFNKKVLSVIEKNTAVMNRIMLKK